jgi:hypothetical protein
MDGMNFEESILRKNFPPDSVWMRGTWYFRLNATGQIVEMDVIVVRTEDWARRKESKDPLWCPMEFGDLTVVVKAQC